MADIDSAACETGAPAAAPDRWRAFLSYSHADAAAARRLHRRLESYRLPRRLRRAAGGGAASDRLGLPDRLGPIFRDREDLPAASDLSESVQRALAASEALVVLCSPEAAASPWVAREIALFRALHPEGLVLAALLRGSPSESFPPALTEAAEPLAADLRREGDGARLGLLKLVAGLAGVPLDALVQRDAQRRVRSVTQITAAALAATLVMAAMTVFALDARDEAEDQRAEAEGLIEFMLTDLRGDLRRVGRLDVMTDVNRRAMAYYESQGDLSRLPAESLERRSRILHAMGEDDTNRGDLDQARAKFDEALRTTRELLARDPGNPGRIFAHTQSEYWVGYVAYREGDWPTARRHWTTYKVLADRLLATDANDIRWIREAGYAEGNLCILEQPDAAASGQARPTNPAAALRHCRASLAHKLRAAALAPGDVQIRQDLANGWAWLSGAYRAQGDTRRAWAAHRTQEQLLVALIAERPNDASLQDQYMRALMAAAEWLDELNREREAAVYRARALSIAHRLLQLDPNNERWHSWARRLQGNGWTAGEEER